jgi:hypothetical protein
MLRCPPLVIGTQAVSAAGGARLRREVNPLTHSLMIGAASGVGHIQRVNSTKLDLHNQREGMGLLEYQAMPSLRGVAHDGWLCTFTI